MQGEYLGIRRRRGRGGSARWICAGRGPRRRNERRGGSRGSPRKTASPQCSPWPRSSAPSGNRRSSQLPPPSPIIPLCRSHRSSLPISSEPEVSVHLVFILELLVFFHFSESTCFFSPLNFLTFYFTI